MAIAASSVLPNNSLEDFRIEFNNLVSDVTGITATNKFTENIIFEGATADAYETTLAVTDPTADRTVTIPNITGTVLLGTQANPDSADGAALGSASAEWSDLYLADSGVIYFGDDQDVTLTHVADTGLLLNSTRQLQFNDASQYISGASATKMDIRATDEIELTSTLVDVVGALTVSGTTTLNGALVLGDAAADTLTVNATLQGGSPLVFEGATADGYETTFAITDPTADRTITFPNATGTVGVSGQDIAFGTLTVNTAAVPDASDGAALGTSSLEWSDLYLADGAIIYFGDDQDVQLQHVADSGLRMPDNDKMMFGTGDDIQLYHSGGNSYITNSTGILKVATETSGIAITIGHTTSEVTVADNLTVSGTMTQTGISTSAAKDVFNAGMSVKNGSTSAGFIEFFEDSDNGTNKATLIGPSSTSDVTITLPSSTATLATAGDVTALAIALG